MLEKTYVEGKIFRDQTLHQATLREYEFADCQFENCRLEESALIGCSFKNCTFTNCTVLMMQVQNSELKNAVFQKCNLIGVHWEELLPSGKYSHALEKLEKCCLKYNTFVEMPFVKFDFSGNSIQESIFEACDLSESKFRDCPLEGTQFYQCDIRKADFRKSSGYMIDITANKIRNAKFSYPEAMHLLDALPIEID